MFFDRLLNLISSKDTHERTSGEWSVDFDDHLAKFHLVMKCPRRSLTTDFFATLANVGNISIKHCSGSGRVPKAIVKFISKRFAEYQEWRKTHGWSDLDLIREGKWMIPPGSDF